MNIVLWKKVDNFYTVWKANKLMMGEIEQNDYQISRNMYSELELGCEFSDLISFKILKVCCNAFACKANILTVIEIQNFHSDRHGF